MWYIYIDQEMGCGEIKPRKPWESYRKSIINECKWQVGPWMRHHWCKPGLLGGVFIVRKGFMGEKQPIWAYWLLQRKILWHFPTCITTAIATTTTEQQQRQEQQHQQQQPRPRRRRRPPPLCTVPLCTTTTTTTPTTTAAAATTNNNSEDNPKRENYYIINTFMPRINDQLD